MVKLSVCVDMVFQELSFSERIKKVAKMGLPAIEFWGWWDKDVDEIKRVTEAEKIQVSVFCTRFESIIAVESRNSFIRGVEESIRTAKRLNCTQLSAQTGNELSGVPREKQHQQLVEGLKEASHLLKREGITLLVEPLNVLVNHKGYYLSRSEEAFRVIDEVGSPNVKVLYDFYHQQITEGNLIATIEKNIQRIGYFHIADAPGRHEPGTGEINYANVIKKIVQLKYNGFIGLEYSPLKDSEESLIHIMEIAKTI